MKNIFLSILLFFTSFPIFSQTGIFFQAIARDNNASPAKDRKIYIQTNILQASPNGTKVLIEEYQTYTDPYGIFSILVGNGKRVGGNLTSLSAIDWAKGPYYLNMQIAITPVGVGAAWDYSKEWMDLGTTIFGSVPYALYSANTAKIDDKLNISDSSKMLSAYAKSLEVQNIKNTLDNKLEIEDTIAMLAPYAKTSFAIDSFYLKKQLAFKFDLADTVKYVKQTFNDSALYTKLNITGSAASLTNFPIFNQNTTGNAATASIAENITAKNNNTLTSLINLNTVGTITNGVWNGAILDITHGGTGLNRPGNSGQVLISSAAGTLTWTNVSNLIETHYIGESYGGGIVFYVYDNGKHGLIISTEDQSTGVNASAFTSVTCCSITNAFRDGINAGMTNTERMITSQGSGNYAALIAANYKGGGYGDWYLPSIAELKLIILQSQIVSKTFINPLDQYKVYWSSNENPANNKQIWANYLVLDSGNYIAKYGNSNVRVRAIRAF